MHTIYEDDYAQTADPRLESDGAVELFWDHPEFPGIWSGRYCDEYPYRNWTDIAPLSESCGSYGAWSLDSIIIGRALYFRGVHIPRKKEKKEKKDIHLEKKEKKERKKKRTSTWKKRKKRKEKKDTHFV